MFNRLSPFFVIGTLILCLSGCAEPPAPKEDPKPAVAAKPPEPAGPFYDLTKEDLSAHPDWTSRNVMLLGAKLGDVTRDVEKAFGTVDKTSVMPDGYMTTYQGNAIGVFTAKMNGKLKKIEVFDRFDNVADAKLKKLLKTGDLKVMHDVLGQEDKIEEVKENNSTEYAYDARGIRFVEYKVSGAKVHSIRFSEPAKK
jgi:hypothetical protein